MASSVKVAGSWSHAIQNVSVKVAGAWHGSTAAYIKVGGVWKQWFTGLIVDSFTRTTTGLGTADTGAIWNTLRGNWYTNGSTAQSDDTPSTYALATVNLGNTLSQSSASVSGGMGLAFWVQDANNWWAVVPYYNSSSYSYSYSCTSCSYYSYSCCSSYTCSCGSSNTCSCNNGGYVQDTLPCGCGTIGCTGCSGQCPSPNGGSCACDGYTGGYSGIPRSYYGHCYYTHYVAPTYNCACPDPGNCCCGLTTCSGTSCSTSTCYASGTNYNYYLRLIKAVNGTVSTIGTDINVGAAIGSISVSTDSSGNISAQAYSDSGLSSAIGSAISYAAGTGSMGVNYGIIKAPSDYAQGATIDNYSVQP